VGWRAPKIAPALLIRTSIRGSDAAISAETRFISLIGVQDGVSRLWTMLFQFFQCSIAPFQIPGYLHNACPPLGKFLGGTIQRFAN